MYHHIITSSQHISSSSSSSSSSSWPLSSSSSSPSSHHHHRHRHRHHHAIIIIIIIIIVIIVIIVNTITSPESTCNFKSAVALFEASDRTFQWEELVVHTRTIYAGAKMQVYRCRYVNAVAKSTYNLRHADVKMQLQRMPATFFVPVSSCRSRKCSCTRHLQLCKWRCVHAV